MITSLSNIYDFFQVCETCGAVFRGRSELVQHVRRVHRPDRAFRACHLCSTLFESAKDLRSHIEAVIFFIFEALTYKKLLN